MKRKTPLRTVSLDFTSAELSGLAGGVEGLTLVLYDYAAKPVKKVRVRLSILAIELLARTLSNAAQQYQTAANRAAARFTSEVPF